MRLFLAVSRVPAETWLAATLVGEGGQSGQISFWADGSFTVSQDGIERTLYRRYIADNFAKNPMFQTMEL